MSDDELKPAVEALSPADQARFRAWFEAFLANRANALDGWVKPSHDGK